MFILPPTARLWRCQTIAHYAIFMLASGRRGDRAAAQQRAAAARSDVAQHETFHADAHRTRDARAARQRARARDAARSIY